MIDVSENRWCAVLFVDALTRVQSARFVGTGKSGM
jgi:hypothetical protein